MTVRIRSEEADVAAVAPEAESEADPRAEERVRPFGGHLERPPQRLRSKQADAVDLPAGRRVEACERPRRGDAVRGGYLRGMGRPRVVEVGDRGAEGERTVHGAHSPEERPGGGQPGRELDHGRIR